MGKIYNLISLNWAVWHPNFHKLINARFFNSNAEKMRELVGSFCDIIKDGTISKNTFLKDLWKIYQLLTDSSSLSSLRHPTWESQLLHSREKFKKEKAIYLCLNDSCEKWVEQKDSWVKYHFPLSQQHILLQKFSFWTLCNFLYFPGDCLKFQWWYYFAEIFS